MERRELEESAKKAFAGAEVTPSENAWKGIELELERARGTQLRKRVAFYQLIAAASVIFAVGFSIGIYMLNDNGSAQPAGAKMAELQPVEPATNGNTPEPGGAKIPAEANVPTNSPDNSSTDRPVAREVRQGFIAANDYTQQPEPSSETVFSPFKDRPLPAIVDIGAVQLQIVREHVNADPVALMMSRLEQREKEVRGEEPSDENQRSKNENLWSSVGFAAGSFTAINAGAAAERPGAILASQANQQARASGLSYSMGINLGSKLSERWVIQGGVNLLSQSSDFTAQNAIQNTNTSTFKPASIGQLNKLPEADFFADEKLISTAPYTVNSNIRYLTIPVQAGYLVLDRDFALQVNAGVATDLFLQNTLSAEGGNIDRTTEDGEDTPYRQVNLSGLAGTELSYKFGRNYRISLNPGLRYPFNSIYKSDVDVKASPLTFDIGLRFRYIIH